MKTAERIVMVLIACALLAGSAWIYFSVSFKQKEINDAVARGEYEIHNDDASKDMASKSTDWHTYFPELIPLVIGTVSVQASVADSLPERIKGLSDTPFLPQGVVKLFVFGSEGEQSIWMKDMNYSLDILWAQKDGTIVHIEENVSPKTYPNAFSSPKPAWYVIEANAGFVASSSIKLGDKLSLPGA
jgi:uncharacterized membrane protein (UPF0127 family)